MTHESLAGKQPCFDSLTLKTDYAITGEDPVVRTPYRVGTAAATALECYAEMVQNIWQLRGGASQTISTDVVDACVSCNSVNYQLQGGMAVALPDPAYPTVGFYRTKDDRHIFIHGGYPALRDGLLKLLDAPNDAEGIAARVNDWNAEDLQEEIAARRLCGVILHTEEEWNAMPQGQALAATNPVTIDQIAPSPKEPFAPGSRPLEGLRVIDFTHVLAGPSSTRLMAEHGADVLSVSGPMQSRIESFVMDTGHGKRAAHLDLTTDQGRAIMDELVRGADVLVESYAPGALDKLGYGPDRLAELRPGIISVQVSCYGFVGPWADRKGWEQLAQTCTGLAAGTSGMTNPDLIPGLYPNDYVTGSLTAYGTMLALLNRAFLGGSYRVRTALSRTGMWIESFGKLPDGSWENAPGIPADRVDPLRQYCESPWGPLSFIGPVTKFEKTPGRFVRPPHPLGHDDATWLTRKPFTVGGPK